jgi:murein DD-endopeptidase MepM/ murein hydrolase activator NlpD
MSSVSGLPRRWICARALAVALIGVGAGGCSGEPDRFDDRGNLRATGSLQPAQRYASSSVRPPLPIPEAPLTAAVAAPKGGSRFTHAVTTANHPNAHPATLGRASIKISKRDGRSLAEVAKINNIKTNDVSHLPKGDHAVTRGANGTSGQDRKQDRKGAVAGEQPSVHPVEVPATLVPAPGVPGSVGSLNAAETLTFHWPVQGQVIAGFGSKINGLQNNGINVAVPEDTSIKAAEDGIVVYSGNQLKSYGNLLLVRHPNGYVTVYAHAKQLLVKGGDEIKRGQVIAKSGRTGDVDTPQVHFEIRKASAPVDPMPYLSGA